MTNKRLDYLDNAKGFAMICIIFGHSRISPDMYTLFYDWIQSWHVPIYLVIAGILIALKEKKDGHLKYNFHKKVRSYIIPFFVFSFIYLAFVSGLKYISHADDIIGYATDGLWSILMLNGRAANWFLPCLLISELLFILERRNLKIGLIIIINLLLAILVRFLPKEEILYILLVIERAFVGLLCLTVGYCLFQVKDWLKEHIDWFMLLAAIIIYSAIFLLNGSTAMHGLAMGNYPFLYYAEIILGSLIVIGVFYKFGAKPVKFLTWFGRNTIVILTTHQVLIELLWAIDGHIFTFLHRLGIIQPLVLGGIVVLLEVPIIMVCNRYLYFLFGKINNNVMKKGENIGNSYK